MTKREEAIAALDAFLAAKLKLSEAESDFEIAQRSVTDAERDVYIAEQALRDALGLEEES